jgi:hypothetical protein
MVCGLTGVFGGSAADARPHSEVGSLEDFEKAVASVEGERGERPMGRGQVIARIRRL